jgi:hypothetical protein
MVYAGAPSLDALAPEAPAEALSPEQAERELRERRTLEIERAEDARRKRAPEPPPPH